MGYQASPYPSILARYPLRRLTAAALRWAATPRSRSAGALPAPHTARATLPASHRTLRPRADPAQDRAQDRAAPPERPCRISRPRVDLPPISPPISPPGSRPRRRPRPRSGRIKIATRETPARARRARRRRKTLPACGERWRATRAPSPSSRRANAAGATGASWRQSWRRRRKARKRREA